MINPTEKALRGAENILAQLLEQGHPVQIELREVRAALAQRAEAAPCASGCQMNQTGDPQNDCGDCALAQQADADTGEPIYGPREDEAGRKIEAAGLLEEASILCEAARRSQARHDDRLVQSWGEMLAEAVDALKAKDAEAALAPAAANPAQDHGAGFPLYFSREQWGIIFDGVMLEIERSETRKQANSESNRDARADDGRAILAAIRAESTIPAAHPANTGERPQSAFLDHLRTSSDMVKGWPSWKTGMWDKDAALSPVGGSADLTMGEAFKEAGGWMNGGELGYPTFGSMNALWAYTIKMIRSYAETKARREADDD